MGFQEMRFQLPTPRKGLLISEWSHCAPCGLCGLLVVHLDETNCPSGGLAAMELLAMTMRAEGMLSCRSLSFKGLDGAITIETH